MMCDGSVLTGYFDVRSLIAFSMKTISCEMSALSVNEFLCWCSSIDDDDDDDMVFGSDDDDGDGQMVRYGGICGCGGSLSW